MTPAKKHLLVAFAFAACALPAASCGPDFPSAVFVLSTGPGPDYAAFARGRIGVPQQEYRTRHLAIAFDILTQRPLTPTEQQQSIAVNQHFIDPWASDPDQNPSLKKTLPPTGFDNWIAARAAFGPVDGYTPTVDLSVDHPGSSYQDYRNCLDDSFATATRTLAARITTHGAKNPSVIEWVRGQDAVYSNCADGKPRPFYGSGQPPPPPMQPHLPAAVSSAPLWLQQDRAYQLAAANLYANNLDATLSGFRAIAADDVSPWSVLSRYLVARTLLRQATIAYDSETDDSSAVPGKPSVARTHFLTALAAVQKELLAMRSEPRMAPLSGPIEDLLDFVDIRLQPSAQAAVLADRLHSPNPRNFGQALIDLTYLRTNPNDYASAYKPPPPHGPQQDTSGMLDWIDAINRADEASALKHWHATRQSVWLLAALSFAQPADPATPELLTAAQALPASDPAFIAINYHRLRLMPADAATRPQLLAILPTLQSSQSPSTLNLYTALTAATAPTLATWLTTAPRTPAAESSWSTTDDAFTPPTQDVCGAKVAPGATRLFDVDAAYTINHQLSLSLLAKAAEASTLPANLRYQVAQATWVRAVLLDHPGTARRMSPLLIACRPAWKPVLDAYDHASPSNRHAAALLALMRFASTEPSVREGEERREGFATYDEFRQNWWCTTVPDPGSDVDAVPNVPTGDPQSPKPAPPPTPPFLTPADLAEARTEVAALTKIPNASTYFALQALDFFKAHPADPHTPDILGEADRVLRNSCRNDYADGHKSDPDATANLAHQVFLALQHYPQSPWTKRYTSWM